MKLIKTFLFACSICILMAFCEPVIAHAESDNQIEMMKQQMEERARQEQEAAEWEPPFTFGEIQNGTFVRTIKEEMECIPTDRGAYFFMAVYYRIMAARKNIELTPEMIADGYWLDGQTIQDPLTEDDMGDAGEFSQKGEPSATRKENTGYITIVTNVDEEIKAVKQNCFLGIQEENGTYYNIILSAINNYTSGFFLPVGNYTIVDGGINADYTGEYPITADDNTFEITEDCSIMMVVNIGDVPENYNTPESSVEPTQEPTAEPTQEPIEELEKDSSKKTKTTLLIIAIVVIMVVVNNFYLYRKNNTLN